jgi:tyrosyl-tRNA synthetase
MLQYFTFLPVGEVEMVMEKHNLAPEKRVGQTCLAKNITLLVHGQAGLEVAQATTDILYNQDSKTLSSLSLDQVREVFTGAPFLQRLFSPGMTVLDLATKVGCFRTEKDAVRIIRAGGFSINMVRVSNTEEVLTHGKHIMQNSLTVIRVGKKNFYIVEWT